MTHREPFRRTLLIFGILLTGPAIGLGWLGWRSLRSEDRARRLAAQDEARVLAEQEIAVRAEQVEETRRREESRPYYHYQSRFMPADVIASGGPAYVETPLSAEAGKSQGPRGWFNYVLVRGRVIGPELFWAAEQKWSRENFDRIYGNLLRQRLRGAPESEELRTAAAHPVPLRVLAANEEVGQMLEEIDVSQRVNRQTPYLEGFNERAPQTASDSASQASATIGVRYTPFRYLAAEEGGSDLALVAWRLVWVPGGESKDRRDAPVDRWFLQGYAPFEQPLIGIPYRPEVADLVRRGGPLPQWNADRQVAIGSPSAPGSDMEAYVEAARAAAGGQVVLSLVGRLPIESVGKPFLSVAVTPNFAAVEASEGQEHLRFLLTVAGLGAVVGIGFFVLARSVRREVEVARKKEDFVAAVTHELKTPLTSIRMYADMLREGWSSDPDSTGDYATKIGSEAQRLDALVDQVLALAAYDHGVASFRPVPGDLGEAVRAAVAMLEPKAAEAGVPVRVEVEEGLPLVPFDAALMRGIVLNLVDNAVKYSARAATKDVSVRVAREGARVALVVSDRGAGIPAKDRKRVFDPFYRAGREETRTATGVGIGLALVQRYADAHGAKIALESEEGKGTTVSVSFPA